MTLTPDLELEDVVANALDAQGEGNGKQLDAATRRQLTLAAVSRRTAEAASEKILLADAGRLVAESLDLPACAVAVKHESANELGFWYCNLAGVGPAGQDVKIPSAPKSSLAGYALRAGRPVVCSNLSKETRFSDSTLQELGVQSALACPLQAGQESLGTLLAMSTTPCNFEAEDVLLLDAIAGVAAVSIAKRRTEAELNRQKRVRNTILETLDAIVLELSPEGRILNFNRACQAVTGFSAKEVKNRHLWSAFLAPEEVVLVQSAFDRLHDGEAPVCFESYLLTKLGDRRRVSWSFSVLANSEGEIETLLGTGIDISDRCNLQEQLTQSQSATNEAQNSLDALMGKIESGDLVFRANESQPFSELPEGNQKERRRKPRRAYPYIQMVGPVLDGKLPAEDAFQPMRCKDIAAGGFSYLCAKKPSYAQCVVAFGVAPSLTYLMARIVHCRSVEMSGGESMYVVGCQYTGRVEY